MSEEVSATATRRAELRLAGLATEMKMAEEVRSVDRANALLCPSAQPEMKACRVLAVVGCTAGCPELAYLNQPLPVTEALLRLAVPAKPMELF
jgi:hypothetical protein